MEPGWGRPQYVTKWHYFGEDGRSLCGDYPNDVRPFEGPTEQRDDNNPQNCQRCLRALHGKTDEVVAKKVHISAPAAILTFEEGTSRKRLSLSLKSLSRSVLGEEDPLLVEVERVSGENRRLKEALEDIRAALGALENNQRSQTER